MAGVARIAIGVIFVIIGLVFLIVLIGLIPLVIGIVLIASGWSARRDAERMREQQQQTNILLQQQLQASRPAVLTPFPPAPVIVPFSPAPPAADRYCPSCGSGNARSAAFCQKCGKPLPPPS